MPNMKVWPEPDTVWVYADPDGPYDLDTVFFCRRTYRFDRWRTYAYPRKRGNTRCVSVQGMRRTGWGNDKMIELPIGEFLRDYRPATEEEARLARRGKFPLVDLKAARRFLDMDYWDQDDARLERRRERWKMRRKCIRSKPNSSPGLLTRR